MPEPEAVKPSEFKCNECGKVLYSEEALLQHKQAKHTKQDAKKEGPTKSRGKIIAAGIVILIILIGGYLALTIKAPSYTPKTEPHDEDLGNASAPVTLEEFSDYECPFCASFDTNTEPQLIANYVDTGKVKIIFKNFPLPSHTNAEKAAEAALCADDVGGIDSFWKLHEVMFKNNNLLTVSNIERYASDIGLNMTEFNACLDSGVMRARVVLDQADAQKLGVTATPTFFIGTQRIDGAQPYATFANALDSALNASL